MNFWRPSKNEQTEMRKSLKDTLLTCMIFTAIVAFIMFFITYPTVLYVFVFVGLIVALVIFYILYRAFGPIRKDEQ